MTPGKEGPPTLRECRYAIQAHNSPIIRTEILSRLTDEALERDEKRRFDDKRLRTALAKFVEDSVPTSTIHEGESWRECNYCGAESDIGLEPDHNDGCPCKAVLAALTPAPGEKEKPKCDHSDMEASLRRISKNPYWLGGHITCGICWYRLELRDLKPTQDKK